MTKESFFFYFFGLFSKKAQRIFLIICKSVEDNRAHYSSQMVFKKKLLILDYRGLSDQKGVFSFVPFSTKALRIFQNFCMSVEDNRAHRLSQMVFLKKFLISDYSVVSKKGCFCPFLRNSYKDLPNFFCMRVEDISIHRLSQMFFLKRLLIQDYRGLSVQRRSLFTLFCPFLHNGSKDLLNFVH